MKLDLYLIIGLTKESRHWSKEFLGALQVQLQPNSIQLIDLPGSGKFLDQKSPTSMKEIVREARKQVTFNPENKRMMIAISLGGMSAWEWVTEYPEDFTHFVMINSSLSGLSPIWKRVQPKAMLQFLKIASASKGKEKERHIVDLCVHNPVKKDYIYPTWVQLGEQATMSLENSFYQVLAGMKFKPVKSPKIPMLVIAARHDKLAHYTCSEAIAAHAGKVTEVKFVMNEDPLVGHGFHVDGPEFLVEQIRAWVKP